MANSNWTLMGADAVYNTESSAPYLEGMLDPTWFDNVERDPSFSQIELRDLPDWCPSTLQMLANNMVPGMFVGGGSCMTIFDKLHRYTDIDTWVNSDEAYTHVSGLLTLWGFTPDNVSNQLQHWKDGFNTVQIIRVPKLKDLEDLLSTFDIQACKVGFDSKSIRYNTYAKGDIETKQLHIGTQRLKCKDPGKLLFRILKYGMKGYRVTPQLIRGVWNYNKDPLPEYKVSITQSDTQRLQEEIIKMLKSQPAQYQPVPMMPPNQKIGDWYLTPYPAAAPAANPNDYKITWTSAGTTCTKCGSSYHNTENHTGY